MVLTNQDVLLLVTLRYLFCFLNSTTSFTFLAYTNAIYMATQENVIRLPVQRCQRFQTQRECLNAMDPYCGWNKQTNLCSPTPNNNPRAAYWVQNGLSCPIMSDPVRQLLFSYLKHLLESIRGDHHFLLFY